LFDVEAARPAVVGGVPCQELMWCREAWSSGQEIHDRTPVATQMPDKEEVCAEWIPS
jgi:hypothetical protein